MQPQGRVALITGGASGMGRLATRRWAEAGGTAVACDVDEAGLGVTAQGNARIAIRSLDVTDLQAVRATLKEVEARYGPIGIAYNAAAIQPTSLLLHQDVEEIHRVMQVNYGGLVNVSLETVSRMLARGRGTLVNFCSIAGIVPNMHFGAYAASKFAAVAFTEVLHHETRGRGVQILCVCPPQVDTPLRAQARSRPKIMETGPAPLPPAQVLDAIERAIHRDRFWVFPGWHTRIGVWLRRFLPGILWRIDHRTEGF